MLLLLLGGDVSLNPGPLTLGILKARSVRNIGPVPVDIVASHDLDSLCLTETYVCLFHRASILWSITPSDFISLQRPHPSGAGGGFFVSVFS